MPLSVRPQCHQFGTGPHRPQRLVKLCLAVAVPVNEHGQIAGGEGRLLPRDRVQGDRRIGDNPLAILPRDPNMILGPLCTFVTPKPPRSRRPDLVLRLKGDPCASVR